MTGSPSCRRPALLLAAAVLWAGLAAEAGAQGSAAADRAALEALYDATGGANWTDNTNWKTSAPLGEWEGVTTDDVGRVTELSLYNHGLTGQLPAELGSLSKLRALYLGVNRGLTGPIPPALGQLVNLEFVGLWECDLTGQLPSTLGDLVNLEVLLLAQNRLTGPIPPALGRLVNLKELSLRQTGVTGPLPVELGSLENLEWLNLSWNALTGPIPASLGNLVNLEHLILDHNDLSGVLPSTLTNLSKLLTFDVSETYACVPSDAAFQQWRVAIEARGGIFSGESCDSHAGDRAVLEVFYDATGGTNWTNRTNWKTSAPLRDWYGVTTDAAGRVTRLVLYANGLNGEIPVELGNLANLVYVELYGNALAGPIPSELGNLVDLEDLWLGDNALTGPIPASLGNLVGLKYLILNENGLSGSLPLTLTNLDNIVTFDVSVTDVCIPSDPAFQQWRAAIEARGGTFSGSGIPCEDHEGDRAALEVLYDSTGGVAWTNGTNWKTSAPLRDWYGVTTDAAGRVTQVELSGNGLNGEIPSELGSLAGLEYLDLFGNELTGPIPAELGSLVNLRIVYFGGNPLTGPIPVELGNLVNLEFLSLDGTALTGPIPAELGGLVNLRELWLGVNYRLTGSIPPELGNLANLELLDLSHTPLTGSIPVELGNLSNLGTLDLSSSWGLSGPLPARLRSLSSLEELDVFATRICAPAAWRGWLATIEFKGRLCETGTDVMVDVVVVYTPAAREAAGGGAAMEAEINLLIAETNQAYESSGVHHRVELVETSEVAYAETGDSELDTFRLWKPSDGHMDEVHVLRDRTGADLVHLIAAGDYDVCGRAYVAGAFGMTNHGCGSRAFAHELGHNMGLAHDRYQVYTYERPAHDNPGFTAHPGFGYVNQRSLEEGAPQSSGWYTMMAYSRQCTDAGITCSPLFRFSNPHQRRDGDPLGIPYSEGGWGLTGPADAVAVLNVTGPAVALWRDRPGRANRPPAAVGTLSDRRLPVHGLLDVDVSQAFVDPDGDTLTYTVSSSAPPVVTVAGSGARLTLTALALGTATIRVTATDPGGLSATQSFTVMVTATVGFTDDPIRPGLTPIKAVHFTELRTRIDALRSAAGLLRFSWTDPVLRAGVTRVRRVHLLELRSALAEAYSATGRAAPRWTDASPAAGSTPIRAAHVTELRAAVLALE